MTTTLFTDARKVDADAIGPQNGQAHARRAVPIVSPPCKCCKMEASALQKRGEEVAARRRLGPGRVAWRRCRCAAEAEELSRMDRWRS